MDGGPRRGWRSDGSGSVVCVRRLRCLDRSVERHVNASLARSELAEPTISSALRTYSGGLRFRLPSGSYFAFTHENSRDSALIW